MANQRDAAVEDKIRNAEKIIQSYAYGNELDTAINYLRKHDPENGVLATIKDFDNNRPLLKELNALYRADVARAENDTAELEKIAEFLSASKSKDLRKEALNMMRELPEIKKNPEKGEAIEAMIAETDKIKHIQEKQEEVRRLTPSMSDDDILANAQKIDNILDGDDFRNVCIDEINNVSGRVSIVDDEGFTVEDENEIWLTKMRAALNDASAAHMDDAAFAAKSDDEKKETLKETVANSFHGGLVQMLDATSDSALKDFMDGKNVKVNANQFYSELESTKERMQHKADALKNDGKEKSSSWLSDKLNKFSKFVEKHCGMTPVEFGKDLLGYFSHRRGITNTLAAAGMVGAALYSIPVGLSAAAAYGVYQSFAPSKWTIWEKKHANYKAAKASGNEQEIAKWKGWNGIRNAYKSIMANTKEKARFERQQKTNRKYGLASAAIVGLATPVIVGGGALLGLAGAGAYMGVRALSSGTRMIGANVNAAAQMKEAKQQHNEDGTAESLKGYKKARTYFYLSMLGTGLSEFCMANNVADAYHNDYLNNVDHNPEHFASLDNENTQETSQPQIEVPSVEPTPEVPTEWNSSMGITQNQWNLLHKIGDFDSKWLNMHNAQHAYPDAFVHADGSQMPIEEGVWMSDRVMALAKAYPDGHGGLIAHMYDENHVEVFAKDGGWVYKDGTPVTSTDIAPECWGTEKEVATFRALYKAINCGEKVNGIDSETFRNLYDKTLHLGPGNNYMDVDNCGKVHFIGFVKKIVNKIVPPVEEPDEPVIYEGVEKPEPVVDGHADDGVVITNRVRPSREWTGDNNAGWMEHDKQAVENSEPAGVRKDLPNSAVGSKAVDAMMQNKANGGR